MKKIALIILTSFSMLFAADVSYKLGEKLYNKECASCHGKNGITSNNVKFEIKPRSLSRSILYEDQIYKIIRDGAYTYGASSNIMPSFKAKFNEKELRSVARYIAQKFNLNSKERVATLMADVRQIDPSREAKMLNRGKKIYNRNCATCHGVTGKGDGEATSKFGMSIFTYDLAKIILDEDQMFLYTKFGGHYWGTDKTDMHGWETKYSDLTIRSIIMYIEELTKKSK